MPNTVTNRIFTTLQIILALIRRNDHNTQEYSQNRTGVTLVKRWTSKPLISLILAGSLTITQAAGPALGVAIAKGGFQIDGSSVSDNATLFGGTTVETSQASSRLQLQSGARIELSP